MKKIVFIFRKEKLGNISFSENIVSKKNYFLFFFIKKRFFRTFQKKNYLFQKKHISFYFQKICFFSKVNKSLILKTSQFDFYFGYECPKK